MRLALQPSSAAGVPRYAYFLCQLPLNNVVVVVVPLPAAEAPARQLDQGQAEEAPEGQQRPQGAAHGLRALHERPAGAAAGGPARRALPGDHPHAGQRVEQAAPRGQAGQWGGGRGSGGGREEAMRGDDSAATTKEAKHNKTNNEIKKKSPNLLAFFVYVVVFSTRGNRVWQSLCSVSRQIFGSFLYATAQGLASGGAASEEPRRHLSVPQEDRLLFVFFVSTPICVARSVLAQ